MEKEFVAVLLLFKVKPIKIQGLYNENQKTENNTTNNGQQREEANIWNHRKRNGSSIK